MNRRCCLSLEKEKTLLASECIPYGIYFSEEKKLQFQVDGSEREKRENRVYFERFCDYFALPTHSMCGCVLAVCVCARLCVSVSWKINATPICRWGNEKYLEPMWMNDWMWRHENTFFFSRLYSKHTEYQKTKYFMLHSTHIIKENGRVRKRERGKKSNKNI